MAIVFAHDVYKKVFNINASEKTLIRAARFFTVLFGLITIGIAMLVPMIGGIVEMVLSTASIAGGALFAPIIWTLYSKRQTAVSVVSASLCGLTISLCLKLFGTPLLGHKLDRVWETSLGVGIPLAVLLFWELYYLTAQKEAVHSFVRQEAKQPDQISRKEEDANLQNVFGIKIIAAAIAVVGAGVALLGSFAEKGRVALIVGAAIFLLSFPLWRSAGKQ